MVQKVDIEILNKAEEAAAFLKNLANPQRLLVLCLLTEGEKCVSDLLQIVGGSQPALSAQLAKLKAEGLLAAEQRQQKVFYRISDPSVFKIVETLYEIYCGSLEKRG